MAQVDSVGCALHNPAHGPVILLSADPHHHHEDSQSAGEVPSRCPVGRLGRAGPPAPSAPAMAPDPRPPRAATQSRWGQGCAPASPLRRPPGAPQGHHPAPCQREPAPRGHPQLTIRFMGVHDAVWSAYRHIANQLNKELHISDRSVIRFYMQFSA